MVEKIRKRAKKTCKLDQGCYYGHIAKAHSLSKKPKGLIMVTLILVGCIVSGWQIAKPVRAIVSQMVEV